MNRIICESHPDAYLINDWAAGDVICSDCGLVIQERAIDVGSEWRTFSNNDGKCEDRSRVGPIDNINVVDNAEKKAAGVFSDISNRLNIDPATVKIAQAIFHKINEKNLLKGRSGEIVVAVCVYIACRKQNIPRTFKELEAVSNASTTSLQRCYTSIINEFREMNETVPVVKTAVTYDQYIARFCNKLSIAERMKVENLARKIANKVTESGEISGKRPDTIAATSIYAAAILNGNELKMNDIAHVTGVAASTIKTTYKMFQKNFKF